jgi:hypothetical protein
MEILIVHTVDWRTAEYTKEEKKRRSSLITMSLNAMT